MRGFSIYSFQFIILLSMLLFSPLSYSAVPEWQIVPSASTIRFTATQNDAPVSANFMAFNGDIRFDPKDLKECHARISVDMSSVSASYQELVNTLKSAPWFNIIQFPTAVFTSTQITLLKDKQYQASGNLTLRDKTVPMNVTFSILDYSPTKFHVKGQTVIKRTLFGIGQGDWADTSEVKDDVKVDFNLELIPKESSQHQ